MSRSLVVCDSCGRHELPGVTVHDFKFDKRRTEIEWHFCANCAIIVGVAMIQKSLPTREWRKFMDKAGMTTFQLHEDFYDQETGKALQPHE